ncbi:uncharacterized protein LOC129584744 [Paramacrobiotus metropolitanus]|uniref:uncharacterized protein LOC129584744 n=1 Tax=Paramacrobiotus metropolitanus TaxID=2943436 RepID=UPI002445941D|nr:uncharacterized protein LOC129584744 [Paramacrobiotus metropolitanus]
MPKSGTEYTKKDTMRLLQRNSRIQPEEQMATEKDPCVIPKLLPLKIAIFFVYGGMAALYPFFTLHMKSIGISLLETAIISCLLPLLSCLFVPFSGIVADKIGHYKWTLLGFSILHIIFHLLIPLVPTTRLITKNSPTHISSVGIEFHCHDQQNAVFYVPKRNVVNCDNGNLTVTYSDHGDNELQIEDCWTDCRSARSVPSVCFFAATGNDHYCSKWDELELQVFKNMTFRKMFDVEQTDQNRSNSNWEVLGFHNDEGYAIKAARCVRGKNGRRRRKDAECSVFCQATTANSFTCTETFVEGSHILTVSMYFVLRLLGLVGLTAVFIIIDTITFRLILNYASATFAMHRIFASIAFVCFPPLSGYLIDVSSHKGRNDTDRFSASDFTPAFILFASSAAAGALVLLLIDMPARSPQKNVWRDVSKAIKNLQVAAVLFVMCAAGMGEGYSTSFLFWFLESELAASKVLLGSGTAVANLLAIPVFLLSNKIIDWIGHSNLLVIGLLLTSTRFLCYAALPSAYWFLVVEMMSGITTAIIYLVPVHYAQTVNPIYAASLQAVVTAVTFGLGRGLGSLAGGYVITAVGHRMSFQIFALAFLIVAIIYVFMDYCFFRNRQAGKKKTAPLPFMEIVPSVPHTNSRTSDLFISDNVSAVLNLYKECEPPLADFDDELSDIDSADSDSDSDNYVHI